MEDPQTVGFSYLTWAQCWMIFRFSIVGTPYFDWLNHAKFSLLLDMRNPFNPTKSIVSMNINIYIYNYIYITYIFQRRLGCCPIYISSTQERPGSDYALESSVRLDNCALNDMIASTFGQQDYLNCTETQREEHERSLEQ